MFKTVIVGTDGSETAAQAVKQAAELARLSEARLVVVSAFEPVSDSRLRDERIQAPPDLEWAVNAREDVNAVLSEIIEPLVAKGIKAEAISREGDAADAILDVAEEQQADVIVVGNKGMTGAKRFLLGSVPNKISHHAPCSVLIIRTT